MKFVECYFDDVIIHSSSIEEHFDHLDQVADLFIKNMKINIWKSLWFARKLKVLGYIISTDGIEMDPDWIEAVKNRAAPKNQKELQRAMGLFNVGCDRGENFAETAFPLRKLLKKDSVWKWDSQCQEAFDKLKLVITRYPVLRSPDLKNKFKLYTDASKIALGVILAVGGQR